MISLFNPNTLIYVYVATIVFIAIFIYVAIRRRYFIKQLGLSDNTYWYIIQLLKIIALVLLVFAITTPVSIQIREKYLPIEELNPEIKTVLKNLTVLHVIIIDESLSMLYTDEYNIPRSNYSIEFVRKYLEYVQNNDIAMIISFAEEPRIICTGKSSFCNELLIRIRFGKNYTDIVKAIYYAKVYADASQYPSVFIIVSDGAHNRGGDPVEAITSINKTYPVLFTRICFDPRANYLIYKLQESGLKVISLNMYTKQSIYNQLPDIINDLRLKSFIAKKILEVKTIYEEADPYPTLFLLITSCVLIIVSKIEGF